MPNVLVDVPESMLAEIDAIVEQRKRESRQSGPYKPTPIERHRAWELAEKQGAAFANEYLKSLGPSKGRAPSRVSVVRELLQIALCAPQSIQALEASAKPEAPKLPARKK